MPCSLGEAKLFWPRLTGRQNPHSLLGIGEADRRRVLVGDCHDYTISTVTRVRSLNSVTRRTLILVSGASTHSWIADIPGAI